MKTTIGFNAYCKDWNKIWIYHSEKQISDKQETLSM